MKDVHLAQAISYVKAYGLDMELFLNFGNTSLQFKRVYEPNRHSMISND